MGQLVYNRPTNVHIFPLSTTLKKVKERRLYLSQLTPTQVFRVKKC